MSRVPSYINAILLPFFAFACIGVHSHVLSQQSEWPIQQTVGPFHFHCDHSLEDLPKYAEALNSLPGQLEAKLGIEPNPKRIHVVLMQSDREYQRYMQHYFPKVPNRRALFIQDRGPGIVFAYRHAEIVTDLRHECTHALLQDQLNDLPLWLDEGLAEYFEAFDGSFSRHVGHASSMQTDWQLGNVIPLEELEACLQSSEMDAKKYSQAWGWVEFLIDGPEPARHIFRGYIADLNGNQYAAGQLSWRMRQAMPDWRHQFLNHVRSKERLAWGLPNNSGTISNERLTR